MHTGSRAKEACVLTLSQPPSESYLTSSILSFHIYKMETNMVVTSQGSPCWEECIAHDKP